MKQLTLIICLVVILTALSTNLLAQEHNLTYHSIVTPKTYMTYEYPQLTIQVTIVNRGTGKEGCGESYVGYYISRDNNVNKADIRIGEDCVKSLRPNEESTHSIIVNMESHPGTWYVGFYIDYKKQVVETNENDNIFCWPTPITVQAPLPNLTIEIDTSRTRLNYPYLNVYARVSNTGLVTADSCRIGYYLCVDTMLTTNDINLGQSRVDSLAPGAQVEVKLLSIDLTPLNLPPNTGYYLGLFVDYDNQVDEMVEQDNIVFDPSGVFVPELFTHLENIAFDPASPAYLNHEDYVTVTFDYYNFESTFLIVTVYPRSGGQDISEKEGTFAVNLPASGNGQKSTSFRITAGNITVDQIEFKIYTPNMSEIIWQHSFPVAFHYLANSITNIQFTPPSPAYLHHTERVMVNFDYHTDDPNGVKICLHPYSDGDPSPAGQTCDPNLYPTGNGSGSGCFWISNGAVTVDSVRFMMWSLTNTDQILCDFYVPVDYFYSINWIWNIHFTPPSPAALNFSEQVAATFSYITNDPNGVRIALCPYSNGARSPRNETSGSRHYPTGNGSGSGWFTIGTGSSDVLVDSVQFIMRSAASTRHILYETFVPVDFHFYNKEVDMYWFVFSPSSPASLRHNEYVSIYFNLSYSDPDNLTVYALPFEDGAKVLDYATCCEYISGIPHDNMYWGGIDFTILSGEVNVDLVKVWLENTNQETVGAEFVPVDFTFSSSASTTSSDSNIKTLDFTTTKNQLSFQLENASTDTVYWNIFQPFTKDWIKSVFPLNGKNDTTITVTVDRNLLKTPADTASIFVKSNLGTQEIKLFIAKSTTELTSEDEIALPTDYALSQNFPNPFNPFTKIAYALPQLSNVRLIIYNLQGHTVCTIEQGSQPAGRYAIQWNGCNEAGQPVASGLYFYRLEAKPVDAGQPSFAEFKKMILMK